MTVEVADGGNVRYQMSAGQTYGLTLGDQSYFITLESAGPQVDRLDDLVTAQKEAMAAFLTDFRNHDTSGGPQLVSKGKVTINGRVGEAFGYGPPATDSAHSIVMVNPHLKSLSGRVTSKEMSKSELDRAMSGNVVVISHDPDLAQLGKAMAKQFGTSRAMLAGMIGDTPTTITQMEKLLESGAPLSFAGMELQSINHAPIDPKRFDLPAQPETLDQIRARMKSLPPPPTAPTTKP